MSNFNKKQHYNTPVQNKANEFKPIEAISPLIQTMVVFYFPYLKHMQAQKRRTNK